MDELLPYIVAMGDVLQLFERSNTNPVLDVLENKPFHEGNRYPKGCLSFGSGEWQSYYHYHSSPVLFNGEHGHFHLFNQNCVRNKGSNYAHVVSLSIDANGQALGWSTTNKWVTGGEWLTDHQLLGLYDKLSCFLSMQRNELSLVETWLIAMLGLYQHEILDLYSRRNSLIESVVHSGYPITQFLDDYSYYSLSKVDVDLYSKLKSFCL